MRLPTIDLRDQLLPKSRPKMGPEPFPVLRMIPHVVQVNIGETGITVQPVLHDFAS